MPTTQRPSPNNKRHSTSSESALPRNRHLAKKRPAANVPEDPATVRADKQALLEQRSQAFDPVLQVLFEEGMQAGEVDSEAVTKLLAGLDSSDTEVDGYYALLKEAGVDVRDDVEEDGDDEDAAADELAAADAAAAESAATVTQDGVRLYFNDIRRVQLLSPAQERALAKKKEMWAAKLDAKKSGKAVQEVWLGWLDVFADLLPEYVAEGKVSLDDWPALARDVEAERERTRVKAAAFVKQGTVSKAAFNRARKLGFLHVPSSDAFRLAETAEQVQGRKLELARKLILRGTLPSGFAEIDAADERLPKFSDRGLHESKIAFDHMWSANLRLVVNIAKRYKSHGLPLMDLCQEGNLGLQRAIEKFNYRMGFKLSTYATWWIKQSIARALADQLRTIRIPVHRTEELNRYKRAVAQLAAQKGREPKLDELAEYLDMKPKEIEELRMLSVEPISLNMGVGDDSSSELGELVSDDKTASPENEVLSGVIEGVLQDALKRLSPQKRQVIMLRWGLGGEPPRTLEEVAHKLGQTRERVRIMETEVLEQLSRDAELQNLAATMDDD